MKMSGDDAQLWMLTSVIVISLSLAKLTTRPHNVAVVAGYDVIIRCSSDQNHWSASWMRFTEYGRVELFRNGTRMAGIDGRRFGMEATDRGRVDLRVRRARVDDAGLYVCSDGDQHASAHLLVVTSPPTCSVNRSTSQLFDVVSGDPLYLYCSLSYDDYFGYLMPHYDWNVLALDDSEQQRVQITWPTTEKSSVVYLTANWPTVSKLLCSVHFNWSTKSLYSDAASNAPSYRGNCTTNVINVLSFPHDVRITDTSTNVAGSRQLQCSAAGRPAPSYEWYRPSGTGDDEHQPLFIGDLLTLTDAGRHEVRCTALNVIRGVTHRITSDTVVVNVLPPLQNDTDMIVDSQFGRSENNDSTVNKTVVYEVNAMSHLFVDSLHLVTSIVVVVVLAVSAIIVVVICCRCRTNQQITSTGTELATAATSTWQTDSQSEQPDVHGNEQIIDYNNSSVVYDEIDYENFIPPSPAESEQYNKLNMSNIVPVVAPGTSADAYSPLQHDDAKKALTKITIAVGRCDVSIVFNSNVDTTTTPSITQTPAHLSASLEQL